MSDTELMRAHKLRLAEVDKITLQVQHLTHKTRFVAGITWALFGAAIGFGVRAIERASASFTATSVILFVCTVISLCVWSTYSTKRLEHRVDLVQAAASYMVALDQLTEYQMESLTAQRENHDDQDR